MKHLYENVYVAGQLQADDFAKLAQAGVRVVINNRPDNEEAGQLDSTHAAELADQHGIRYYYLPMTNGQPLPPNLVAEFKEVLDSTDDKILAHCRSGMRSSFLWALGQIADGTVTVDQAIEAAQAIGIPLKNARAALENVNN